MDCLILRLDAPMMSFGAVVVDQRNPTWRFPAASMLTGLLGNTLGWSYHDTDRQQELQDRLRFAARWDAEPEPMREYQTVDLGQDFLLDTGWTTRGQAEKRKGGDAKKGTHIRERDYWANGVLTVALTLDGEGDLSISDLEAALKEPARPPFFGRKNCLPAGPLFAGRRQAESVKEALAREPLADIGSRRRPERIQAQWPIDEGEATQVEERYDLRDWVGNIHRGSRRYAQGFLEVMA
ncbi:type I-E CRISPR-associated protein Cas5/CasD [Thioalkalivibrio thiocyanodenitrificans]|uniref:type I-E CRISPR-associated protein Cas5/CasD n=1 Tax=Thioalkalivibrio thiocyanodenitrificans TaxID=243063 RepID=UPI00035EFAC4|nr:type I-E CRISPR-associated protein Cas5/CasD [Thioalkalivibrio thiocyanodenitrificans]